MEKVITYVTGNWAKIESAKQALEPLGYTVDNIKMDTPEIQADDVSEVAKYSAKWACEKLNKAVLKNDAVEITVSIIVLQGYKASAVATAVQKSVKSAIQNMANVAVSKVNVKIADIMLNETEATE